LPFSPFNTTVSRISKEPASLEKERLQAFLIERTWSLDLVSFGFLKKGVDAIL